MLTFFK